MTGAGHNRPPAFDAMAMHIEDLFQLVSDTTAGATVTTDEQEATLDDLLNQMRQARKDADAERIAEKRPHDDAAKAVQVKWLPLLRRCEIGADEIKKLLTPYRTAKQAKADEEAAAARREAQARMEAAQAALQSDDLERRFAGEAELAAAKKLEVVANKIDRAPTGLRTRWIADLTDPAAALKHYRATQPDALKAWLLQMAQSDVNAGRREIPGFTVAPERKAA